ncbi:hypothetical protein ACFPOB_25525 [Bosea eneae]|uniref:Uncharacterized protein n=1 Tax=Bosea eneae TaxID=151454 RepID=A0ABW0J0J2_9HYPH
MAFVALAGDAAGEGERPEQEREGDVQGRETELFEHARMFA